MAKKINLKVEFEAEKLRALNMSLEEKGKDLELEIIEFLEKLYTQNVHKSLRDYIEKCKS